MTYLADFYKKNMCRDVDKIKLSVFKKKILQSMTNASARSANKSNGLLLFLIFAIYPPTFSPLIWDFLSDVQIEIIFSLYAHYHRFFSPCQRPVSSRTN